MMIRGDQHVDDWAEIAVDYLDGRLDDDTRVSVEAHLADCPECAARLHQQQYVVTVLQEAALVDPPEDLEYRSIGELVFPSPGAEPLILAAEDKKAYRTPRWHRTVRAWIPATVAVCALLAAVVGYGIARSNSGGDVASDTLRVPTTTAGATTTAAALGEASPVDSGQTVEAAAGAATTTTAAAGAVDTTVMVANSFPATEDPKAMVSALESAQAPIYVAFRTAAISDDTGATSTETTVGATTTTTAPTSTTAAPATTGTTAVAPPSTVEQGTLDAEQVAALKDQIKEFTGLDPVDGTLWISGPTFAVYLPRQDAVELVDLIRSVGASLGLTVSLDPAPPSQAVSTCEKLMKKKDSFPILEASRTLQPAPWGYDFTTSTLGDEGSPSTKSLPDADGSHVVVVIWIAE